MSLSATGLKPQRVLTEVKAIEIDDFDPADLTRAQLKDRLKATFGSPEYRPPALPSVAMELMDLSSRASVEVSKLAEILERDQLLAARVLKIVSSPGYAGRMPILSLKEAVVRLGLARLRDAIMEAALQVRVFRAEGYAAPMQKLARHSTATAYLARLICRYVSFEGEHAFLCGLLHDVGVAAIMIALGDVQRGVKVIPFADVQPLMRDLHEEVGNQVLATWNMRPEISLVVANHHAARIAGHPHPLVAVIHLAEKIAEQLGYEGLEGPSSGVTPQMDERTAMQLLNMTPKQRELLLKEARDLKLD